MKLIKHTLAISLSIASFGQLNANELEVPHTFESNTPAVAAQVNENFSAIRDGVVTNSASIDSISAANAAQTKANEERLSQIEGTAIENNEAITDIRHSIVKHEDSITDINSSISKQTSAGEFRDSRLTSIDGAITSLESTDSLISNDIQFLLDEIVSLRAALNSPVTRSINVDISQRESDKTLAKNEGENIDFFWWSTPLPADYAGGSVTVTLHASQNGEWNGELQQTESVSGTVIMDAHVVADKAGLLRSYHWNNSDGSVFQLGDQYLMARGLQFDMRSYGGKLLGNGDWSGTFEYHEFNIEIPAESFTDADTITLYLVRVEDTFPFDVNINNVELHYSASR